MIAIPVITVDGPSGSGKGTLSRALARTLGWHFLDSGALYRLLAFAALKQHVALDNAADLSHLATHLKVVFAAEDPLSIFLDGEEVTAGIRTEACGGAASQIAAIPEVRVALLERQRSFKMMPGLVADGRDMGTVVFPEANMKIFLEASAQIRAKRRQLELKARGLDVSLDDLFIEISERDARDRSRAVSPLVPAKDAILIDSTNLSIEAVYAKAMEAINLLVLTNR